MRRTAHLMRTWYKTDADDQTAGTFSKDFPINPGWQLVGIKWDADNAEVEVTWLVPGGMMDGS